MPERGLQADEMDQLRKWGAGLQNDSRSEVAAAGKAISLLIEEIERLHLVIWERRLSDSDLGGGEPIEDVRLSLAERVKRATGVPGNPQRGQDDEAVSTTFPQRPPQPHDPLT